jgi:hypothetical protein
MEQKQRSNLTAGILMILVGAYFLATRIFPDLMDWTVLTFDWPLIIIGVGALLLFIGLLTGTAEMAVPASILAGIGSLLYWQNATGKWESWTYVWTLIPGFVGFGVLLSGVVKGQRDTIYDGGRTMLVSLILFAIFGSLLGAFKELGFLWPAVLILLGLVLLIQSIFRKQ